MNKPTPEQVKSAREAAQQTQKAAAAVIHKEVLAWQRYESGAREMDAAFFELYLIKTNQHQTR